MTSTDKQKKKHVSVVIVGHVDAGKSTTTGRLLVELGNFSKRDLEKLKQEAKELGKESFFYAFVTDSTKHERESGITVNTTTKEFFTDNYHYTIIDAPGHRNFIKNMISGASQADVCILMVPATQGGFEKSIAKGNHKTGEIEGQTRQHARLCYLLGIEQMIVCVNKMDDKLVNCSEERYLEIKDELSNMLTKIGYKMKKVPVIPISGFNGDNLTEKTKNMKWYHGFNVEIKKKKVSGYTLLDALDKVIRIPKRSTNKKFIMPLSNIMKVQGVGDVVTGKIEQGKLISKSNVIFYPSMIKGKAFSIEMHHKQVEKAVHGDNIGVCVRGLNKQNMPKVGDIMCIDDEKGLKKINNFTCLIFVQDHPGKIKVGFTPIIHVRTSKCPCKIVSIKWKMNKASGNTKLKNPSFLQNGDQAEIIFEPQNNFIVTKFDECKPLGRIAGMNSNSLVLLGKVINTNELDAVE